MTPTEEQQAAIDLATTHDDLTIEALAGCGKTSTLKLISDAMRDRAGSYISFNKSIVEEARNKFPANVTCSTAHSLAYQAVGKKYSKRLNGARQLYRETAEILGIHSAVKVEVESTQINLAVNEQVHSIKGTVDRFCQGGDRDFQDYHIPVPEILRPWAKQYRKAVAPVILPLAEKMWEDIEKTNGTVAFNHGHYLKIWQLSNPKIETDFLLFDEAQDANGVMLAIVQNQSCQKIFVGDSYQQIYSWNGAVNAMQKVGGNRCWLTESWRFGQGIADVANQMLTHLGSPAKLVGRGCESRVTELDTADAMLFRTNGACVNAMFGAHDAGLSFHLVGGVTTIDAFANAAAKMQKGQPPFHPELNCFQKWSDVVLFADTEEADGDLPRMVKMISKHGVRKILEVLQSNEPSARNADVTISTAHKAKGCEWDDVIIGSDFSHDPTEEDQRLLYVAATRAKKSLDYSGVRAHFEGINHECV